MANKYIKICSTYLAIKEMQINSPLKFYPTPVRKAIIKKTATVNAGKNVGKGKYYTLLVLM
jgi:hypothetical protein